MSAESTSAPARNTPRTDFLQQNGGNWTELARNLESELVAANEKFHQHTQHVGEFLSELYGLMCDPCADGKMTVLEIRGALLNAATRDRDLSLKLAAARDLLAVIHRDGGHHTDDVGFVQSCKDAQSVRHQLVVALSDAQSDFKRLQETVDFLNRGLADANKYRERLDWIASHPTSQPATSP